MSETVTKQAHTPGPWRTLKRSNQLGIRVIYVVSPDAGNKPVYVTNDNITPEVEANARLIAAAPEMLEALEQADFFLSHTGNQRAIVGDSFGNPSGRWNQFQKTKEQVQAAIRKAKGEQ